MMFELPPQIPASDFLENYWQKKPLLMRKVANLTNIPSLKSLFPLAATETVESRIVLENGFDGPWEAHHGPFDQDDIANLPHSHWTLLIQDADKHLPEIAPLLKDFRFIPSWRVDDIMISYATDQGSVGPHTDEYDVFLIQASGKRRWKIHQQSVSDDDLLPDLDLKILRDFDAEQEWILEPGDVLYLPPNVAHWGVAEGECTTWSVGFRAPSVNELMISWVESQAHKQVPLHYRDSGNLNQTHKGEVSAASLQNIRSMLERAMAVKDKDLGIWLGHYLTEPKENLEIPAREEALSVAEFTRRLSNTALDKHPWSRMLFITGSDEIDLFAGGERFSFPIAALTFVDQLCDQQRVDYDALLPWIDQEQCMNSLCQLFNSGHLKFSDE